MLAEKLFFRHECFHISTMLLTVLAADAIWESSKEVLKYKGAGLLEKIGDSLLSRTEEGALPPNHNLDHALRHSLAKTARVLAYTIHDPDLSPLSKLIADLKVSSFLDRLSEMLQNNILEEKPADYWLSALISVSKSPENFKDFSLDLLLKENQLTSLVHERLDKRLGDFVQNEFVAWSNRHVPDPNGIKPACFDDYVLNGWPLPGGDGRKITFYEIFCLFFREELKKNPLVFHAFTVNTLAELKADMAEMLAAVPSAEERERLEEAFHKLGDFDSFKEFLDSQDAKMFASLTRIEAGVTRLETGQTELKAGMELLLESHQAIYDEIKRPQLVHSAGETDEKLPDDIKSIIKEAGLSINEGRYADARQKLETAKQLAEKQSCNAALMEIRIDVAESHILEHSDVVATRDDLLSCLRELSKERVQKRREVLNLLGDAESFLGNLDDAKSLYRESRKLAQKQQSRFAEARALIGLSHVEEFLGNLAEANKLLDEATELYRAEYREATDDEKPRVAMNLGACLSTKAMLVRREARLAESILHLTKAEPFFREAKSLDNLGRTILFKAELLFNEAKWQEGFDALTESMSIFESIGSVTWQCRCLDRFALFFFTFGKEGHALACLEKILQLVGSRQSEIDAVPYLLKFAHLCRKQDETTKSKEFVSRAKEIATQSTDDSLIAECLVAEARFLTGKETETEREKLFVSAVKHLESALSKCEIKGRRAEYMQKIGDLYGWLCNIHEARAWFERALHEYEEIGYVAGIGESLASLAATAREEKSPDEAIVVFERLLKLSEGKPLHHLRAGTLHDLASLKLSQGKVAEAKHGFEAAKALAEKHNFRDVLDALKVSLELLENSERVNQPPQRDFPALIRELHDWCERYPKFTKGILPLWYYFWRVELWSICRSMLGVKFLVCVVDSAAFRRTAESLRTQGDFFAWGINFSLKIKHQTELIPFPLDHLIPAHLKTVFFKDKLDPADSWEALKGALRDETYVLVPFDDTVKEREGTCLYVLGRHIRLTSMISKMMLDTSAKTLIDNKWLCLPLSQNDDAPSLIRIMHVALENGMIPIFSERFPHSDEVKAVCDGLLDMPSNEESVTSAIKKSWAKLMSSCQTAPQKSLSEFSNEMAALFASASGKKPLRARVYLLRFQAGLQEVVHPAAVLVSQ